MKIKQIGVLDNVLPEDYLELSDRSIVKNLGNLVGALKNMRDEDFSLHVYEGQNDFAEWVMEAYWNEVLAEKILRILNKKKMIKILEKVLREAEKERILKIGKIRGKNQILKSIGDMK